MEASLRELNENNSKLATLKAERDATKRGLFPVFNLGNKNVAGDRIKDGQKDLHDLESTLKKLTVIFHIHFLWFVHEKMN